MTIQSLLNPFLELWQNIAKSLLVPDELLAIMPANNIFADVFPESTLPTELATDNQELIVNYQILQSKIGLFNILQNHIVSTPFNKDPLLFEETLPEYLKHTQQIFQRKEHLLDRNLQHRLAMLMQDFSQNQGKLNYQHLSQLEVFRADLQKYCLDKQKELQLELKSLETKKVIKIAVDHQQTMQVEKYQASSPIFLIAQDIMQQANFSQIPQALRVFFVPPSLSDENSQNNSNFPIPEETLENYLRAFLEKYTDTGRTIDFFGGAWKSDLLRGKKATKSLFLQLQAIPTLILDAIASNDNFQLRYSFWPGHTSSFRYQSPIKYLPWRELLYHFAKQRSLAWQAMINQRQVEGEKETDIKREYSFSTLNHYQHNLQMLAREEQYLGTSNIDLTVMDERFYHLQVQDYENLAKVIGLCQNIISGLIADEYFLVHVPVDARKMPLLPYLLPELLEGIEPAEQIPLIKIIVDFYDNLYNIFLQPAESAWIPTLRLQLAESLLVLSDKQWAVSQIFASINSWLKLQGINTDIELIHQIPVSYLSDIITNNLTIADQDYINKLNQCLQQIGENLQFSIVNACWERGIKFLQREEYAAAIHDLTQVLQLDANHIANYYRGLAYSQINQDEEAIADFSQALLLNQALILNIDDAQIYYERGSAYYKLGEYQKALDDYHQAWLLDPHIPNLVYRRDVAYGVLKQIEIDRLKQEEQSKGKKLTIEVISVNIWGEEITRKINTVYQKLENLGQGIDLAMIYIPAGSFFMGANQGEIGANQDEYPQHLVNIPEPFYMSQYPITQAQYKIIMNGENPSDIKSDQHPVERINWDMAVKFCKRLSAKTGKTYRLPTEAQWEYAARSGTQTPFHFGDTLTNKLANYRANYTYCYGMIGEEKGETTDVGSYPPNGFGLYDMHGNVWEWCRDDWHRNYYAAPTDGSAWLNMDDNIKVLRGGSWSDGPAYCRAATRYYIHRSFIDNLFGFRICTKNI